MHRVVRGLKWAKALDTRPAGIPVGRPRGAKRMGVKYERELAAAIPTAWHGKWFEFVDAGGVGVCQPDLLLRVGDVMVILEAKYTWVAEGHSQINWLYKPVVEAAFGMRAVGLVVCKNLTPNAPKAFDDLDSAIKAAIVNPTKPIVLHWIAGLIGPRPKISTREAALALL